MSWKTFVILGLSLAPAPWLAACGEDHPTAERVGTKVGEAWNAMTTWGVERKAELVEGASKGLADLKQAFAAAKAKGAVAGADAGGKLEAGWANVEQKFAALKDASGDKWVEARDAFMQAYAAMQREVAKPAGR